MDMLTSNQVSVVKTAEPTYEHKNVSEGLKLALLQLGLDGFIRKGDKVLIKPNLIRQSHLLNDSWEQMITNGAVIEAVVEYVFKALGETGKIIIADGPQADSDFDAIYKFVRLGELKRFYKEKHNYEIDIFDLREERWVQRDGVIIERIKLPGDPRGYVEFDLGGKSEFEGHECNHNYYGADYDFKQTQKYHSAGHHRYRVARTALEADVFINLPKLKTHKKPALL